jgi:hypothetical protein
LSSCFCPSLSSPSLFFGRHKTCRKQEFSAGGGKYDTIGKSKEEIEAMKASAPGGEKETAVAAAAPAPAPAAAAVTTPSKSSEAKVADAVSDTKGVSSVSEAESAVAASGTSVKDRISAANKSTTAVGSAEKPPSRRSSVDNGSAAGAGDIVKPSDFLKAAKEKEKAAAAAASPAPAPAAGPAKRASVFIGGGAANKCPTCTKSVYAADPSVSVDGHTFHKACFQCAR